MIEKWGVSSGPRDSSVGNEGIPTEPANQLFKHWFSF
jgi:hypothetical protein